MNIVAKKNSQMSFHGKVAALAAAISPFIPVLQMALAVLLSPKSVANETTNKTLSGDGLMAQLRELKTKFADATNDEEKTTLRTQIDAVTDQLVG